MSDESITMQTKHDWSRVDAMTDAQVHAAALADPDARPLTEEHLARMKPVPRSKIIRRALRLTQEEFATRFWIPLETLRDWEQGRKEPDQTARAYLRAIAGDASAVLHALQAGSGSPVSEQRKAEILAFVDFVVPGPSKEVWLVGSRAEGTARQDSDWDVVAFTPDVSSDPRKLFCSNQKREISPGVIVELVVAHPSHKDASVPYMEGLRSFGIRLR